MKRTLLALLCCLLLACNYKKADWTLTFNNQSKNPYGTYLTHKVITTRFPHATLNDLPLNYNFIAADGIYSTKGKSMLVLCGKRLLFSETELSNLLQYANDGNEVLIFADDIDGRLLEYVHLSTDNGSGYVGAPPSYVDSADQNVRLAGNPGKYYRHRGRSISTHFIFNATTTEAPVVEKQAKKFFNSMPADSSKIKPDTTQMDSSATEFVIDDSTVATTTENLPSESDSVSADVIYTLDTLGYSGTQPSVVRLNTGSGHITLSAVPITTTNYFLLQHDNIDYLYGILSTLPDDVAEIHWMDFVDRYPPSDDRSPWNRLMAIPPIRNAILLSLLIAVLYVAFNMKRRQRKIPEIPPLRNELVSFAETVGQLYYNKRNNRNLAEKMIQQLLDWVRTKYYVSLNEQSPAFADLLSRKTGVTLQQTQQLVHMMQQVRDHEVVITDEFLLGLYKITQDIYKKHTQ